MQSALLEVMAERQVSIGGKTFPMPDPFLVLATQNPIENEGVYPLPEAQRDRFLFKIIVEYPTSRRNARSSTGWASSPPAAQQVLQPARAVRGCRTWPRRCSCTTPSSTTSSGSSSPPARPPSTACADVAGWVAYGASPRASLGIVAAARALALIRGRDYVLPQDVLDVAPDVLRHRLVLSYDALADAGADRPHHLAGARHRPAAAGDGPSAGATGPRQARPLAAYPP